MLANLIPVEAQPLLADLRSLLAPDGVLVLSGLMADQLVADRGGAGALRLRGGEHP